MSAKSYARLAAVIFGIIALMQFARAIVGWPATLGGIAVPIWPSWIAFVVAALLAWLGFRASRT